MTDILLSQGSLVGSAFADAGMVLFGLLLMVYGAILVLTILIKLKPMLALALAGLLKIQMLILLGIVALDFSGVEKVSTFVPFAELSSALSTHRWLLIQLPFILLLCATITLLVYQDRIVERHARSYYILTILSIYLSFATILLIGFESMI